MYKHQHRSADDVLDKSSKAKLMSPIMGDDDDFVNTNTLTFMM